MTGWLTAACVLFCVADLGLVAAGVKRRSVLPTICGVGALVLLGLALASGLVSPTGRAALVISVIPSAIGTILLWLGEALWRLLDDAPEPDEATEARRCSRATPR